MLLPVLLALPLTLALAVYWGGKFGYGQLFMKVSTAAGEGAEFSLWLLAEPRLNDDASDRRRQSIQPTLPVGS